MWNCLKHNTINNIQLFFNASNFKDITIYEADIGTKEAYIILDSLQWLHQETHFVLISPKNFLVHNLEYTHIVKLLSKNCISIVSFDLMSCALSQSTCRKLGSVLSSECIHLKHFCISNCNLEDFCLTVLFKTLFSSQSVMSYMKAVDVSYNQLTVSILPSILESLHYCAMEKLIIMNNKIEDETFSDALLTDFHEEQNLLNFTLGIPLIVIGSKKLEERTTAKLFLSYSNIDVHLTELCNNLENFNVDSYTYYLLQSMVMVDDIHQKLCSIVFLQPLKVRFVIFETNLLDHVATKIALKLTKQSKKIFSYILVSTTMLLISEPSCHLIAKIISSSHSLRYLQAINFNISQFKFSVDIGMHNWRVIDVSKCLIDDHGFKLFYLCLSCKKEQIYIKQFNLSLNCFTSNATVTLMRTLVKLLQFCIIENLVMLNSNISYVDLKHMIFTEHFKHKNVVNLLLGIPLTIITSVHSTTDYIAMIFLSNCKVNINTFHEFFGLLKCYDLSHYLFILYNSDVMANDVYKFHVSFQNFLKHEIIIFVYELKLKDSVILKLATHLNKMASIICGYILLSDTKCIACKSNWELINNIVFENYSLQTVCLQHCNIDFPLILNDSPRCWNELDITGCNIGDHNCLKLYNSLAMVKINSLNLSQNELSPISAKIVTSLIVNCEVHHLDISMNSLQACHLGDSLCNIFHDSCADEYDVEVIHNNLLTCIQCNGNNSSKMLVKDSQKTNVCFLFINCKFNSSSKQYLNVDLQPSSISSLQIYNSTLCLHHIQQIAADFLNIDLFMQECFIASD